MTETPETTAVPTEAPEVNLDALARGSEQGSIPTLKQPDNEQAQEGQQAQGQETTTEEPAGEISTPIPEGGDITAQIAAERGITDEGGQAAAEGAEAQPRDGATEVHDQSGGETAQPQVGDYGQMFDALEARLGKENVTRPEELNQENYLDELARVFYENADWSESFDPRVIAIQENIENGVPFEDAISPHIAQADWTTLSSEQKVRQYLDQGLRMKPEEIEAEIKNMNVNVKAKELDIHRGQHVANQERQMQEQAHYQQQQMSQARDTALNDTLAQFKETNEIWNIPVNAKQRQEFPDKFKQLITPNEQGVAPIADMLRNNELLMKLAFFVEYGEPGIKDLLHNAKAEVKQNMKSKLDPEPNFPRTQTNIDPQKVDLNALAAPARN